MKNYFTKNFATLLSAVYLGFILISTLGMKDAYAQDYTINFADTVSTQYCDSVNGCRDYVGVIQYVHRNFFGIKTGYYNVRWNSIGGINIAPIFKTETGSLLHLAQNCYGSICQGAPVVVRSMTQHYNRNLYGIAGSVTRVFGNGRVEVSAAVEGVLQLIYVNYNELDLVYGTPTQPAYNYNNDNYYNGNDVMDFDSIHTRYGGQRVYINGYWAYRPAVARDWVPLQNGRFEYTSLGLTWVGSSNEPWSWMTDHYGYWRNTATYGWVWFGFTGDQLYYRPFVGTVYYTDYGVSWSPIWLGAGTHYYGSVASAYRDGYVDGFWDGYRSAIGRSYQCGHTFVNYQNFYQQGANFNLYYHRENNAVILTAHLNGAVRDGRYGVAPGVQGGYDYGRTGMNQDVRNQSMNYINGRGVTMQERPMRSVQRGSVTQYRMDDQNDGRGAQNQDRPNPNPDRNNPNPGRDNANPGRTPEPTSRPSVQPTQPATPQARPTNPNNGNGGRGGRGSTPAPQPRR